MLIAKRVPGSVQCCTCKKRDASRPALAGLDNYTALRGPLEASQLADVERIQRAYVHLATLVDDLLSYNKLAAGQS